MALLDDMGGMNSILAQFGPQLLQMMQMQQQDPFTRPIQGENYLNSGMNSQSGNAGWPSENAPPKAMDSGFGSISTDFANTQPGLPNLPDSFAGFGYGQTAPKTVQPGGIKQQLIQQLLNQLPMLMNQQTTPSLPQGFGGY